ncbi:MAG: hypothetical protein ABJC13_09550 [Acidobacteriota bacterium]
MDGFFTHGILPEDYRLPHPRLGLPVILLVRRVLVRAFEILSKEGGSLATLDEDGVTLALRNVIENDLRHKGRVPGFNRHTFDFVSRPAQVENFDCSKRGKSPDLCFRLRNDEEEPRPVLSVHDALFVECKPVDTTHAAGGEYCDKGLCRFVDGDYAWAMEEAMMLGYARASRTIAKHLIPAMQEPKRLETLKTVELPRPTQRVETAAEQGAEALHVSRHRRGFIWLDGKGPATDIWIYHSWHQCD